VHEFYLMCDDVEALIGEMKKRSIPCDPVQNQVWGLLTHVTLPGGGKLGIYEPRHARPKAMGAKSRPKKLAKRAAKKRRATPK
jgi:hypothetical protein